MEKLVIRNGTQRIRPQPQKAIQWNPVEFVWPEWFPPFHGLTKSALYKDVKGNAAWIAGSYLLFFQSINGNCLTIAPSTWIVCPAVLYNNTIYEIYSPKEFEDIFSEVDEITNDLDQTKSWQKRIKEIDTLFENATNWGSWMSTASHERKGLVNKLREKGIFLPHKWEITYGS